MITVLVLEEERKVYELFSQALKKEGYSFVDEPVSGGIIKIVKKADSSTRSMLGERAFELKNMLFSNNGGEIYKRALGEIEKSLIETALERTAGNQLRAAQLLGINRNTLAAKIKKLAVEAKKWKIY
ncbi:MAG: helix-turn-helix domain-containing protein [Candidatus Omnitrophica bacterium]|nr:helix-turn-helix domain-containing protein [Candidatus Omnitrophota bacterium]